MKAYQFTVDSPDKLSDIAEKVLSLWPERRVFALSGKMGAGKTTFIKAMCKVLGSTDNVCSPTFAIINVYHSPTHGSIYHFDLYRLKNIQELLDTGAMEYFDSGNYCFIEWPEMAYDILPSDFIRLQIDEAGENIRIFTVDTEPGIG